MVDLQLTCAATIGDTGSPYPGTETESFQSWYLPHALFFGAPCGVLLGIPGSVFDYRRHFPRVETRTPSGSRP